MKLGIQSIRIAAAIAAACAVSAFAQQRITDNENTTNKVRHAESSSSVASKHKKVDLNNATKAELEALPGVGSAIADNIIAARPFKTVEGLKQVPGVGEARYDTVHKLVTVHKPTDSGAPPRAASGRDAGKPTQAAAEATRYPQLTKDAANGKGVPVKTDPSRPQSNKPTSEALEQNRPQP